VIQLVRGFTWAVVALVTIGFVAINWHTAQINIWPMDAGFLHLQWPLGMVMLVSFLLGMTPMWLLSLARRWRLKRRIANLENALLATTPTPPMASQAEAAPFES
jgi:putative membrane protein